MPYQLSWYQPDRIVLMELTGLLATTEVQPLITAAGDYVQNGKPLVHFLLDTTQLQKIESVPEILKVVQHNPPHPNMGWMLVIGAMNPLVRFFLDFAGMLMRARYRRFDTREQALKFLADMDSSLTLKAPAPEENQTVSGV